MMSGYLRAGAAIAAVAGLFASTGCAWFGGGGSAELPGELAAGAVTVARPPERARQVTMPPTPPGLLAFDFGTAVAWEGFTSVPGADAVSISTGAEFGADESRDADFPDPLTGDFLAADEMTVTVGGLEKGLYRTAVIAQNVAKGMVPAKDFRVTANGRTAVDFKVTPEWYFSQRGFFYGVQFDDLPDTAFWDRYVEPVAPWREFTFDSRGQLVLKLSNCRLYALVIAPAARVSQREFDSFIEATQAARKAYFVFNKFRFEPLRPEGKFAGASECRERGYVVFSRPWGLDVSYNSVPRAGEVVESLSAAGTPGERVPVTFSVRALKPLSNVNVTVSDLSAPGGKAIPAGAVRVEAVRYMMKPAGGGAYVISPETIQEQQGLNLPANVAKRWWLTMSVPPDAEAGLYTGQIRFTPENAPGAVIALSFEVYPFVLEQPQASIGVWYSDPRSMGYFTEVFSADAAPTLAAAERARKAESYRVAMLEADLKSLCEHGFNGITVEPPRVVAVSSGGRVVQDFSALEAYKTLLPKYGINTAYPGQTNLLDTARRIVAVGLDGAPIKEYSDLHALAYKDAVAQIRDWWRAAGVRMLAYAVDEPREEEINPWNRNLAGTLHYLRLIEEVGGFPTTVTTMRDEQDGVDYSPILENEDVVQPHPSTHNAKSVAYARKSGKPLRFFNGGGFERYDFGFYLWSQRPEGYWQWHYNFRDFSFNPFWDSDVGYVVFPSPAGPVPTVRYERTAQGIYDYRYAVTLEEYIRRARASYNSEAIAAARDGEALLEEIRGSATQWVLDKKWRHVSLPDGELNLWRGRIAQRVMKIQAALN